MDVTVDPGLVVTHAELTQTGSRITIEVGPQQQALWSFYDQVDQGHLHIQDVPGISHPEATPFAAEDGSRWYRATLDIGQDVNEKLKQAARGVCRSWSQAETEDGSGDSRTQVEESFREFVQEIENWTSHTSTGLNLDTPQDMLDLIEALDDMDPRMPDDPYDTRHAPTAEDLENLL